MLILISQYLTIPDNISNFICNSFTNRPPLSNYSYIIYVLFLFGEALTTWKYENVESILELVQLFLGEDLQELVCLVEDGENLLLFWLFCGLLLLFALHWCYFMFIIGNKIDYDGWLSYIPSGWGISPTICSDQLYLCKKI